MSLFEVCTLWPSIVCMICLLTFQFGVEIRLSQFTLTKLVIVTPYYVLVNETEVNQSLNCLC